MPGDRISQREIRWVSLGDAAGSEPAGRRPCVVIQGDRLNHTRWATTVVAALTTNLALDALPGSVLVPAGSCGLPRHSVILTTALATVDKSMLGPAVGVLPIELWRQLQQALDQLIGAAPE